MNGSTPSVVSAYPRGVTMNASQIAAAQAALTSGLSGVVVRTTDQRSLDVFASFMTSVLASKLNMSFTVAKLKA